MRWAMKRSRRRTTWVSSKVLSMRLSPAPVRQSDQGTSVSAPTAMTFRTMVSSTTRRRARSISSGTLSTPSALIVEGILLSAPLDLEYAGDAHEIGDDALGQFEEVLLLELEVEGHRACLAH